MFTLHFMRLVAVSIVKNEADIIEAFVRHTRGWVDHHLIFDHASTDGTRQILGALQTEGLPITLFTDDALGNLQQARSNHLTRLAAEAHAADWILPLDADEIFTGPDRAALEQELGSLAPATPASLPLLDYYPTAGDDATTINPVLRLRHCQTQPSRTRKLIIPRQLVLDDTVTAGKGSHALYRGTAALPDQPLAPAYHLAHLALRSPQHQVIRVVLAELQKVSRGRAAAGLDVHYRLGYQLLAENPELFFATIFPSVERLRRLPIDYRGTALCYTSGQDWSRVVRALLPYLDQLAASHGRLLDAAGPGLAAGPEPVIRPLTDADLSPPVTAGSADAFSGFMARDGWGETEGPVPEAFLPPFHWGFAPTTTLAIPSAKGWSARLIAEALTYSEAQIVTAELNGAPVLRHAFTRVNQKETLDVVLPLRAGENLLRLHYTANLRSPHDPRPLAVIFLALRILPS